MCLPKLYCKPYIAYIKMCSVFIFLQLKIYLIYPRFLNTAKNIIAIKINKEVCHKDYYSSSIQKI